MTVAATSCTEPPSPVTTLAALQADAEQKLQKEMAYLGLAPAAAKQQPKQGGSATFTISTPAKGGTAAAAEVAPKK